MLRLGKTFCRSFCALAVGITGPAFASSLNIWTVGDSITDGVGDTPFLSSDNITKPDRRAYRDWLQQNLVDNGFTTYNFIGGRDGGALSTALLPDGVTPFDPHNWGRSGQTAADLSQTIDGTGGDAPTDPFGSEGLADVVLLQIGANSVTSSPPSVTTALTQHMGPLLDALEDEYLLSSGSRIAPDARIFVAQIMPKATSLDALINTYDYNAGIQSLIDSLDPGFKAQFAPLVDMYAIDATDADMLSYLAQKNGVSEAEILAQINPNTDDDTVDWVLGFDELAGDETTLGSFTGVNTELLNSDAIHPSDLGYQLLAYQFYQAMANDPFLSIPEPTSLALFLLGGGLLMRRRRVV